MASLLGTGRKSRRPRHFVMNKDFNKLPELRSNQAHRRESNLIASTSHCEHRKKPPPRMAFHILPLVALFPFLDLLQPLLVLGLKSLLRGTEVLPPQKGIG